MPDLLVPVPMYWLRLWQRQVNPAHALCLALHQRSGIAIADHALRRVRNTTTQQGLNKRARARNLRKAFEWKGKSIRGKHIGLIDDVMTTGTTLEECAKQLRLRGAGKVSAWVLARVPSP